MSKLLYFHASQTELIEEGDHLFIKTFLVDSSINANKWAVTEKALRENISSFIGKPIVLTPTFDHPQAKDGDALLIEQEKFRIGTILDIGLDELSGKGWALAEITDKAAIEMISQQGINFVSPSIVFGENDILIQDGVEVVTNFEGAHHAIVKDPAYGMQKAQIKGQCKGSKGTCLSQLQKVQASIEKSPCGKYLTIRQGSKQRVVKASKCVEDCLRKKSDSGIDIDDQAIAICFSECGESREGECKVDQLGNCVTNSSLSENKENSKVMTEHNDEEEEKARKAQDEEDEKKEEARKAQEDEEKKEEEARKAQDEDKEKKVDDIAKLKAQVDKFEKQLEENKKEASVKPVVDKIVSAKVKLNHIKESETTKEFEALIKLPAETLSQIAKQYESFNTSDRPYSVLTLGASTETSEGDNLLIKLGSVD